jgi:hypothetical protein
MFERMVIANAFSLNMLDVEDVANLTVIKVNPDIIADDVQLGGENILPVHSIVGHKETAALFSTALGFDVPCNRETFVLDDKTLLTVGQYKGPRLEEGATQLPDGASIEWYQVWLEEPL